MTRETYEVAAVKRLRDGDLLAFNRLFDEYSGRLYGFGMKYLHSEADAEEMVQNIFMKIWQNREQLDPDKSFKAYLFTIAFNEIRKFFRRRAVLLDLADSSIQALSDETTESDIAYYSFMDRVNELLQTLTERQRSIFEMSRFENMPAKEIAARLNISPKTVDNQVSEVIRFLRGHLGESLGASLFIALFLVT